METELRSSNLTALIPDGVRYFFTIRRYSSSNVAHHSPSSSSLLPCSVMEVNINNKDDSFTFPCFSCSGFPTAGNYHNEFRSGLADAFTKAFVLPSPRCATAIAQDILRSLLRLQANNPAHADKIREVSVLVHAPLREDEEEDEEEEDEDGVSRVLGESFEEAGPPRKRCKIESVTEMIMEKFELDDLEADKAESDWKESGSHDCVICIEEIESIWDSVKMPCSHVFHDKCLKRWLDDNHVCPLCRFELPLEDMNDAS